MTPTPRSAASARIDSSSSPARVGPGEAGGHHLLSRRPRRPAPSRRAAPSPQQVEVVLERLLAHRALPCFPYGVVTTHYLDEADAMAERIVVVDHGEVIADAGSAELRARHAEDRLELHVDDVAAAAGLLDGAAVPGAGRVELRLEHGARRLPGLLARLDHAGVTVHAAHLHEASLDDVFLALTGRSLREEGAAA